VYLQLIFYAQIFSDIQSFYVISKIVDKPWKNDCVFK
jgi:hypothetical protein